MNNELQHFGVLGMKWGKRKSVAAGRRVTNIKEVSTADLQKVVNRLRLEQEYKKLTTKQKSKGKQVAEDILVRSAKTAVSNYIEKATKGTKVK